MKTLTALLLLLATSSVVAAAAPGVFINGTRYTADQATVSSRRLAELAAYHDYWGQTRRQMIAEGRGDMKKPDNAMEFSRRMSIRFSGTRPRSLSSSLRASSIDTSGGAR